MPGLWQSDIVSIQNNTHIIPFRVSSYHNRDAVVTPIEPQGPPSRVRNPTLGKFVHRQDPQ